MGRGSPWCEPAVPFVARGRVVGPAGREPAPPASCQNRPREPRPKGRHLAVCVPSLLWRHAYMAAHIIYL